ncbi:MAG: NAD(P)/FAD-dependent oxidoreductase [Bacteroidia bacterium]|nr:NAD(P)/FAD-dependent oxidoreductase [Bacteroidia bacterium]
MSKQTINIAGAGFTGLSLGYYLAKAGWQVNIFEKDAEPGGLAGSFKVEGENLEKFYHHWFTNDKHIMDLIKDLGTEDHILVRPTRTGMYYSNNFFKLSSPLDLLKFKPLNLINRIRLGFVVLAVRTVKNWKKLENVTAKDWLIGICGKQGYEVVWEPLLKGKFGRYAETVSAVWFWNKLKLRGGSRGEKGKEFLAYYKGGFASLAESMAESIQKMGGIIQYNKAVNQVENDGTFKFEDGTSSRADKSVLTLPLPICANLLKASTKEGYIEQLEKIQYIGNVCLTLELTKSLSEIYWLNVNDPGFPFVGIIEHTNFEPKESYKGRHIVYLSKYLPTDEKLYQMTSEEFFEYALPFIQKMFPDFNRDWVLNYHVWREPFSQPLVTKHYSQIIPDYRTPVQNLYINTMAQVYPEDRGTNYAVREGKLMAEKFVVGKY